MGEIIYLVLYISVTNNWPLEVYLMRQLFIKDVIFVQKSVVSQTEGGHVDP
jgi:hypothetical protein